MEGDEKIEVSLNIRLSIDKDNVITVYCPRCLERMTISSTIIKSISMNKDCESFECDLTKPVDCLQKGCSSNNPTQLNYVLLNFPIHKGEQHSSSNKNENQPKIKKEGTESASSIVKASENTGNNEYPTGSQRF